MKNDHMTLRLPDDLARALARWARDHGLPKSEGVREALTRYLVSPAGAVESARRLTARELAMRWPSLPRLTPDEAAVLEKDIAAGRDALPPVGPSWE